MDELDRLRDAHTTIPHPEPASVDAARDQLRRAMSAEPDSAPSWNGVAGRRHARTAPARRGRRRLLRSVAVTVLAAAGIATVALWPAGSAGPAGPSDALAARLCLGEPAGSAGPCLRALGDQAAADDVLASGRVFYRRDLWGQSTMYIGAGGRPQADPRGPGVFAIVRAGFAELWVTPDRAGRIEYGAPQRPYLPSAADRRAWEAAGRPDIARLIGPADPRDGLPGTTFEAGELDEMLLGEGLAQALPAGAPLRDLSAEPAVLGRQLERAAWFMRVRVAGEDYCEPDLSDCPRPTLRTIASDLGRNVTQLLRYPFASGELRGALLAVLGDLPGTRRLGALEDPLGRRGAAILLRDPYNDGKNVVLFDVATGRLLAQGRAEDSDLARLRWQDVFDLEVAGVGRIGERPD